MSDAVAALTRPRPAEWTVRGRVLSLRRPLVVGIVNVTPDSFSDGGRFLSPEAAVAHAEALAAEGADLLDVGGESTRPQGATPVDAAEERRRVVPVVREVARRLPGVAVSIDTVKAEVAEACLDAGASVVNDVSGFRLDPALGAVCARAGAGVILMHSRGGVSEMATYAHARYGDDVTGEVVRELGEALARAADAGVAADRIALDPGIGFAKRGEHSLRVLAELPRVVALGHPVVVGVSRKRFIGELTGVKEPAGRIYGTVGANVAALARGARLFRVHDVRAARHALDVAWAALGLGS
ncbi:MAG TPA: dihydropteroate synthase [Gemmatimonadaceae bacterium]|nr:dihydropteroate synthase [Gemmatimonadaceae bacterium]